MREIRIETESCEKKERKREIDRERERELDREQARKRNKES